VLAASTPGMHVPVDIPLSEDWVQRLASLNPVALCLEFEKMVTAIFTHLLGMPPTGRCRSSAPVAKERAIGIAGKLTSWTYIIELNKRKAMHFHAVLNGGLTPKLLANVAGHKKLMEHVTAALDTLCVYPFDIHIKHLDAHSLYIHSGVRT